MRKEHSKNNAPILIVEDNPVARMALQHILEKLDEPADVACTGEEAIEKIKCHNYRLILMDISLPGKDGCEVTRMIRQWEKAHQLPPSYIVAQSSHLDEEVKKQCLAIGMNAGYSKPLTLEIVTHLIKAVCCST